MKLKKVTKRPCLKGLLWAIMYQKRDTHTSLGHSQRKALPRYKVQHCALVRKFHSPGQSGFLGQHLTSRRQGSPPKTLWKVHSVQLQWHQRVSQSLPAVTTAPKGPSCSHLRRGALAAESLQTHQPSHSTPNPKCTKEEESTLNPRGHCIGSAQRCQQQGCILNPPLQRSRKEISPAMH